MDIKTMLKKLTEINNKADKNHTHADMTAEIVRLQQTVDELEGTISTVLEYMLYFQENDKKQ